MTDTSLGVAAEFRARLMALSPAERRRRGALMFDASRTMAQASMPPGLSEMERRCWQWRRFYPELPPPWRVAANI